MHIAVPCSIHAPVTSQADERGPATQALAHPPDPQRYAENAERLQLPPRSTLVAIGNFDGVHAGHRAVLERACIEARDRKLTPLVLTFHPHPSEVLGRGALPRLTTLDRKVELILKLDPSLRVVVQPFDRSLAALEPETFVDRLLVRHLGAALVQVGRNFRFGRGRSGDLATLTELGAKYGFEARAEALFGDATGAYSSTRVREAVASGDLEEASRLLGRPHLLSGTVVEGQRRGRTLGFPTANLSPVPEALPPDGVYAVLVDRETEPGKYQALARGVMNLGERPTFAAGRSSEVHLLDRSEDLYGCKLRVHLIARIRAEQRFSGVDALRAQIADDVRAARSLLPEHTPEQGPWG